MSDIKFITEQDETGLGRIVVDGKYYGLPAKEVALLRFLSEDRERLRAEVAALKGNASIPEGWVMVPEEPTDEMVQLAIDMNDGFRNGYKAMIAAAPKPQE